ncbi:hypothetical protein [Limnoglobus roseus]|uniref:Uncharacterized protein n=1 Tax=Limnoglobus roseus TaxID=2598579 RepID=A0A5C1A4Y9_9BACT|nr:hypothetical protein [Limnoglobus roseus]QEL14179.1 hypothetical protein PX52LOC_01049 [Limnoglobus roseus]
MKYAVLIVTCAFLGGVIGLLSAWGAAAYCSPTLNPDPRPGWFASMPWWGAVTGTAVGLLAVVAARAASHPVPLQEPNHELNLTGR